MSPPLPFRDRLVSPAALLPGLAGGLLAAGALSESLTTLGARPDVALGLLGMLLVGGGLGAAGQADTAADRRPPRPASLLVAALAPVVWWGATAGGAGLLGGLLAQARVRPGLVGGVIIGAAGALAYGIGRGLRRAQTAGPLPGLVGLIAGAALGLALPAPAALVLSGAAAAAGRLWAPPPPLRPVPRATGLARLAALVALPAVLVPALLAVRVATDPSPRLLVVAAVSGLLGHLLGRRQLGRLGGGGGLVLAGLVAAGLALAAPRLVGLLRVTTLPVGSGPAWLPRLLWIDAAGALLGLAAGLGTGGAWGRDRSPIGAVALGAGLWIGLASAGAGTEGWRAAAGIVAALLFLGGGARGSLAGTAVAGALGLAVLRGGPLPTDALATGLARSLRGTEVWDRDHAWRESLSTLAAAVGPGPASAVRVPRGSEGAPSRESLRQTELEIEGRVALLSGRAAAAERLAGHLAGLLAPRRDRVLVLGDDAGHAFRALGDHPVGTVEIATPAPLAVRGLATLDPALETAWLAPTVRLRAVHPELALRASVPPSAIVEIFRSPWADAARGAPTARHAMAVDALLDEHGVYIACLHLDAWAAGTVAGTVGAIADRFAHVQLWLPPDGADSLVVVASQRPVPLRRLVDRFSEVSAPLPALRAASPTQLAGLAVADGAAARAWAAGAAPPSPWALSPALLRPPVLHLAALADHIAPPSATWSMDGVTVSTAELQGQLDIRRSFLQLLDQATKGDMAGVFQKARTLQGAGGGGPSPLAAITGPYLEKAQAALEKAVAEGPGSREWSNAERFASTAQVLSPGAVPPLLLLAEISLAQGDLSGSQSWFEQARELDPESAAALTGLARVARARKDPRTAEMLLRKAVSVAPREWRHWQNLGTFLMEQDKPTEAEEALERAVGLASGAHPAPNLALAELLLEQGRPSAALVHAQRALVIAPTGYGHYLHGRALYDMDQIDEAEDDFRQAILAQPDLVAARGAIGTIRAQKGDLEAASKQFQAVLQLDPGNVQARENLDRVRAALDRRAPPAPRP